MSNSPVKIVGAAARVASGGSANPGSTGTKPSIDQMIGIFGGAFKKNKRLERAKRAQALADYKERAAMTGRQRMRAQRIQAAQAPTRPADELSNAIPDVETNNAIDNTTSSAALNPPQPMAPVQPVAPVQPQTPTFGVAGMGLQMFGTPEERQVSMGSSLMKRACKYKNKK